MTDSRHCPHCNADLRGKPIPEKHFIHKDDCQESQDRNNEFMLRMGKDPDDKCFCLPYGDIPTEERFFSNTIGIEIPGVYDGVLFWQCPACSGRWHRWTDPAMRAKAAPYVDEQTS